MDVIEILTVKELARILKITRQQVRKMIRSGEIPAVKVGREWRIPREYLNELIEETIM